MKSGLSFSSVASSRGHDAETPQTHNRAAGLLQLSGSTRLWPLVALDVLPPPHQGFGVSLERFRDWQDLTVLVLKEIHSFRLARQVEEIPVLLGFTADDKIVVRPGNIIE